MDRTAWIVVILCAIGLGWLFITEQDRAQEQYEANLRTAESESVETAAADPAAGSPAGAQSTGALEGPAPGQPLDLDIAEDFVIETDHVAYLFSRRGGGIAEARMLMDANGTDENGPVILNRFGRHAIGALSTEVGEFEDVDYQLEQIDESTVRATGELENGLRVVKTWSLPSAERSAEAEGHLIRLRVDLEAGDTTRLESDSYAVGLGSVAALKPDELPTYTMAAWQDGGHHEAEHVNWFQGGKILWLYEHRAPSEFLTASMDEWWWSGVMNQFYTTMVSPLEEAGESQGKIWAQRFPVTLGEEGSEHFAIEAASGLGRLALEPGQSASRSFEYYMGPKNYALLKSLGGERSEVLDYGGLPVFGWMASPFSKILNLGMNLIAGWLGSVTIRFALAIILTTIVIRALMWPLHARAQRTMKKMAKLKPKMDELKEKYSEDPQRMQQENMKLMSSYGVNPLGGCLPMLLQMPIFLGFYRMLFFAAELRHEPFLWVDDLSAPDTVAVLFGLPINPLPLVMAGCSLLQLKLTPASGDPTQRRMMYAMPAVMLFICYNFAAALALYWTVSNLFTIFQMLVMQRLPEPELKKVKKKTFAEKIEEMQAQRARMGSQSPAPAKKPKKNRPRTGG